MEDMVQKLVLLLMVLVLVSSCSINSSENEIKGKPLTEVTPVQVNWVGHWKNEGYKEELLYKIARRFEFENQDIVLNLKFMDEIMPGVNNNQFDFDEIQKPKADWDILRINNEVSGITTISKDPEWPVKYLIDFSTYEKFRNNSVEAVTSEATKKRWGGIVPGHALDAHNFVLWCNKDLAEKIGINVKQFDITSDDFEGYLQALQNYNLKNNTTINAISYNSGWCPTSSLAQQLFSSLIGDYEKLKDPNYSNEKILAWEQVLRYLEKLSTYKPVDSDWKNIAYGTNYKDPLNDDCLFMVNGTWMYNIWKNLDSISYKKMIPLELPAMQPAKTYIGDVSIPWIIPKNAAHLEQAIRFMLFWCQPDVADDWKRNTKSPTGIKGSLVQSGFGVDVYETFDYMISKKYEGKKLGYNSTDNTIYFGKNNSSVPNYFIEVLTGTMSANEAIRNIKNKLVKN